MFLYLSLFIIIFTDGGYTDACFNVLPHDGPVLCMGANSTCIFTGSVDGSLRYAEDATIIMSISNVIAIVVVVAVVVIVVASAVVVIQIISSLTWYNIYI